MKRLSFIAALLGWIACSMVAYRLVYADLRDFRGEIGSHTTSGDRRAAVVMSTLGPFTLAIYPLHRALNHSHATR